MSADPMQDPVNTVQRSLVVGGDGGRRGERRDSWDDLNKAMERGIVVLMCCWEAKCGEEGSRAVVGRGSERHLECVVAYLGEGTSLVPVPEEVVVSLLYCSGGMLGRD
jgi:hypothetical protein